jgi:hypothetical protein
MIRPKGGRAQSRFFQYKEASEEKLMTFLKNGKSNRNYKKGGRRERVSIDLICSRIKQNVFVVDQLIGKIQKTLAEIQSMSKFKNVSKPRLRNK